MNFSDPIVITALIALAGTLVTALLSYTLGRRKSIAEPAKLLANGYSNLVSDQRSEINDLRTLVDELEVKIELVTKNLTGRINELETEVHRLREENASLGLAAEQMRVQLLS